MQTISGWGGGLPGKTIWSNTQLLNQESLGGFRMYLCLLVLPVYVLNLVALNFHAGNTTLQLLDSVSYTKQQKRKATSKQEDNPKKGWLQKLRLASKRSSGIKGPLLIKVIFSLSSPSLSYGGAPQCTVLVPKKLTVTWGQEYRRTIQEERRKGGKEERRKWRKKDRR